MLIADNGYARDGHGDLGPGAPLERPVIMTRVTSGSRLSAVAGPADPLYPARGHVPCRRQRRATSLSRPSPVARIGPPRPGRNIPPPPLHHPIIVRTDGFTYLDPLSSWRRFRTFSPGRLGTRLIFLTFLNRTLLRGLNRHHLRRLLKFPIMSLPASDESGQHLLDPRPCSR